MSKSVAHQSDVPGDIPDRAPAAGSDGGTPATDPAEVYQVRCARFAAERDRYEFQRERLSQRIFMLGAALVGSLLLGFLGGVPLVLIAAPVCLIFLIVSAVRQGSILRLRDHAATLLAINNEGPLRLARDWTSLPLREPSIAAQAIQEHPYAADLDLLGHASLLHLLGTANTPGGQTTLQSWLLEAAPHDVIVQRQGAVKELMPASDIRDEIAAHARGISLLQPTYEPFLRWCETGPWLMRLPVLIWLSRILPALTIAGIIAEVVGWLPYPVWIVFAVGNLLVSTVAGKQVEALLERVSSRQSAFLPYANLFAYLSGQEFQAADLRDVQQTLAAEGGRAAVQMRRLARIMRYADLRLSVFFPLLQFFLLWNFHVLWLLERWKAEAGNSTRAWLATLNQVEALAALATLGFDHPAWCFPQVAARPASHDEPVVVATGLGHPLLSPAQCVGNDVTVGPPGTFILVSGSNMSGKSTLLRSIGINVALAQAGAPACATTMRLHPTAIVTSMRVRDSLELGISYFMAELKRLKVVVGRVGEVQREGKQNPLFLLDEILAGTNTGERRIAAAHVIMYLVGLGATGAVSTHDLALAESPELRQTSRLVHFTESFTRGPDGLAMHFDYVLRSGVATTSNALKLMEMAGLPLPNRVT